MQVKRSYAVIPAAGHSRRMGEHKLLMPWNKVQVIDAVLKAWTTSRVSETLVIIRRTDNPLRSACERWPVTIIELEQDTPDMKSSVLHGIRHIETNCIPGETDRCLIAPADLPRMTAEVIDLVLDASNGSEHIVVPWYGDKQGHPVSVPWKMMSDLFDLGPDQGLDVLIADKPVKRVNLDLSLRVRDIDTPADYQREQQH